MKSEKGITLIALVITIIVLLILAGITIATLLGDNGILAKGKKAKLENEKGKVLEIANLAYISKQADLLGQQLSKETALSVIIEDLQEAGYEVKTVANSGSIYDGVDILEMVDTTGRATRELNLQQTDSTTIEVNLKMTEGASKVYVNILGKYYEIIVDNKEIRLSDEGETSIEGEEYTLKIVPTKEKATMKLGDIVIAGEQEIVSGAQITVTAKTIIGEEGFKIKVEKNDGTTKDAIDAKVIVAQKPIHAESIKIDSNPSGITEIKEGDELQLNATLTPDDVTDGVVWSSNNEEVATVNSVGVVTGVKSGTVSIKATCGELYDEYELTVKITPKRVVSVDFNWDGSDGDTPENAYSNRRFTLNFENPSYVISYLDGKAAAGGSYDYCGYNCFMQSEVNSCSRVNGFECHSFHFPESFRYCGF